MKLLLLLVHRQTFYVHYITFSHTDFCPSSLCPDSSGRPPSPQTSTHPSSGQNAASAPSWWCMIPVWKNIRTFFQMRFGPVLAWEDSNRLLPVMKGLYTYLQLAAVWKAEIVSTKLKRRANLKDSSGVFKLSLKCGYRSLVVVLLIIINIV